MQQVLFNYSSSLHNLFLLQLNDRRLIYYIAPSGEYDHAGGILARRSKSEQTPVLAEKSEKDQWSSFNILGFAPRRYFGNTKSEEAQLLGGLLGGQSPLGRRSKSEEGLTPFGSLIFGGKNGGRLGDVIDGPVLLQAHRNLRRSH